MAASVVPSAASPWTMRIDEYEVYRDDKNELGSGSQGMVYRGRRTTDGEEVAVKRMRLADESTEEGREWNAKYIDGEIRALQNLDHDNIVKLYHWKREESYMYLFIELCAKGSLSDYVLQMKKLRQITTFQFMQQIASALEYLHSKNIIHRDIKPANTLVTKDVTSTECVIKLTDFGTARQVPSHAAMTLTHTGSRNWMAPEVYPDKDGHVRYNNESDTFSTGVMYLSMIDQEEGKALQARTEQGMSLGYWMSKQDKPVKMPVIIKENDDKHKQRIKLIIEHMICPEPSHRYSMKFVNSYLQICKGLFNRAVVADALQLEMVQTRIREDNDRLQMNVQEAQNQVCKMKNTIESRDQECNSLHNELQQAKAEMQQTKTELQQRTGELQGIRVELQQTSDELDNVRTQYHDETTQMTRQLTEQKQEYEAVMQQLQSELSQARQMLQDTTAESSKQKDDLTELQQENDRLHEQLQTKDAEQEKLHISLNQANIRIAGVEKRMVTRDEELLSLNTELAAEKANHENKICLLGKARDEINPLKEAKSQLTAENVQLKKDLNDTCNICKRRPHTNPQSLDKCHHIFCKNCIEGHFKTNEPLCPTCGKISIVRGNQPEGGTMESTKVEWGSFIKITYFIPDGTQGSSHPHPGARYQGLSVKAYLYDDAEGRKVLKLLERAFQARLTFSIGQDNKVTWNIEHHTTNPYVYPYLSRNWDNYYKRVQLQLAAKGIK